MRQIFEELNVFCDQLKNNLDELQEFQLLEDEMSKYKTLNMKIFLGIKFINISQFILLIIL